MSIVPKEIILQEHNSSRLIFVDCGNIPNNDELILYIENTTKDPGSTAEFASYCDCDTDGIDNPWLLGRLTANVWLLEDAGVYDSNHEHTAKIYYIDPNTNEQVIMYKVKRAMEWGEECDRLYTEEGGGTKMRFVSNSGNNNVKFFIKYEKTLAGTNEKIVLTNNGVYGIEFYKRYADLYGITSLGIIKNRLLVTKDETDAEGNPIPFDDINYCDLNIQDVSIDFSSLNINYNIDENNTNDIKIGIISVETGNNINQTTGELSGTNKFVSQNLVNTNACINPSYFIVQPPKNRSWICYRFISGYGLFGLYYNNRTMSNGVRCAVLNIKGTGYPAGGLTGMYGEYNNENNNYTYEISLGEYSEYKPAFHLLLPSIYTDFIKIEYRDKNNVKVNYYSGETPFMVYNELDGIYYRVYSIPPSSSIHKFILIYKAS